MIRSVLFLFALSLLVLPSVARGDDEKTSADEKPVADEKSDDQKDEEVATREVTHGALTLQIPEAWKDAENPNRMRLATYKIPPAKEADDEEAGKPEAVESEEIETELAISHFPGGGGGIEANIARWIQQFESKERKAEVRRGVAPGDAEYFFVEVSGTYMKTVGGGGPFSGGKKVAMDDYRAANVMLILPEAGVYFLKMTGPSEIVAANVAHLRSSFGAKKEDEKEIEL